MTRLSATIRAASAAKLAVTGVVCVRLGGKLNMPATYLPTTIGTDTCDQETEAG